MKLILTAAVDKLGLAGDVVEVKDGYGRNFLVPRGLAIAWTKGAREADRRASSGAGTPGRSAASTTPSRCGPSSRA